MGQRATPRHGQQFRAIIAWGQVYEATEGNPATNSRVQIKDIETHVLGRDGRWNRVQFSVTVEGGAFVEDFQGNVSKVADVRTVFSRSDNTM